MPNKKTKATKTKRTKKKNEKRNSLGLNFNTQSSVSDSSRRGNNINPVVITKPPKKKSGVKKSAHTTKQGGSGKLYDPQKKRVDAIAKGNSIVSLVKGVADTVKYVKKKINS